MSGRPDDIFGAVRIKEQCGECGQRPVVIASLPSGSAEMNLAWACDEHISALVDFVRAQGLEPERHVFEVSRTCRALGAGGTPCGAAGDYLVVRGGGNAVITVCERHAREWKPDEASGGLDEA